MTTPDTLTAQMAEQAQNLRTAAAEIRAENHNGWGNACEWAAQVMDEATARITSAERERDELRAKVAELQALVEAGRVDAERLEWLSQHGTVIIEHIGGIYTVEFDQLMPDNGRFNFREAIDAARAAQAQPAGEKEGGEQP